MLELSLPVGFFEALMLTSSEVAAHLLTAAAGA
jgi:hypothetical protein